MPVVPVIRGSLVPSFLLRRTEVVRYIVARGQGGAFF